MEKRLVVEREQGRWINGCREGAVEQWTDCLRGTWSEKRQHENSTRVT
jgi:hypothetical protein